MSCKLERAASAASEVGWHGFAWPGPATDLGADRLGSAAMEELQAQMDELLIANPEMTFYEATKELVNKGELNYDALEDPNAHVFLFQMFQHAKRRGQSGRVNKDM
jgi:hypothetical protein